MYKLIINTVERHAQGSLDIFPDVCIFIIEAFLSFFFLLLINDGNPANHRINTEAAKII